MLTFFNSWRRTTGCVLLAMALVSMGGWIRSRHLQDQLIIAHQNSVHILMSMNGALAWSRSSPSYLTAPIYWSSKRFNKAMEDSWDGAEVRWKWQRFGFDFGAGSYTDKSSIGGVFTRRVELWQIPYWAITIPLTLLSAYLILWKPNRVPPNTESPIHA
jgi:hypothetical protein